MKTHEGKPFTQFNTNPTTFEIRTMHFIESAYISARVHTKINVFITILFYIFLYLNTIVTLISNESKISVNSTLIDVLCFIISFNTQNSTPLEVKISLVFITSIIIAIGIIAIITFSLSFVYRHLIISLFQFSVLYVLPLIFVVSINVFQRSYIIIDESGWDSTLYFGVLAHDFFLLLVAATAVFFVLSPYISNHPFFARNLVSEFVTIMFFLIIVHADSYYYDKSRALIIFRLVVGIAACIYTLISIPYFSRNMTAMFFSYTLSVVSSSIYFLVKPDHSLYAVATIALSILISFIVYYLILPFAYRYLYSKEEIFFEFFFGHYEKVRELLINITEHTNIPERQVADIATIAFYMDSEQTKTLLRYSRNPNANFGMMIHLWIMSHLYNNFQQVKALVFNVFTSNAEKHANQLEKQFWNAAWYSDIANLPILAGKLGRYSKNLDMLKAGNEYINSVLFPNETRNESSLSDPVEKNKSKNYFGWAEVFLILNLLFFITYLIISLTTLMSQRKQAFSYQQFSIFVGDFFYYQLNQGYELAQVTEQLQRAYAKSFKELYDFYMSSGFFQAYDDYSQAVSSSEAFPYDEFSNLIIEFDRVLYELPGIFESLCDSKVRLLHYLTIGFYSVVAFLAVLVFVIHLFYYHNKIVKMYERFRYLPKSAILTLNGITQYQPAHNSERYWIDHKFNVFSSFRLSIALDFLYLAVSFVFIGIASIAIKFNSNYLNDLQRNVYVTANVYRIPLHLVESQYTSTYRAINIAQYYANSFLSDSALYHLVEMFPNSFYDLVGRVVFEPNEVNLTVNETFTVVDQICQLTQREIKILPSTIIFHTQRFMMYSCLMILLTFVVIYIVLSIRPISEHEREIGNLLYEKIRVQNEANQNAIDAIHNNDSSDYTYGNEDIEVEDLSEVNSFMKSDSNISKEKWSMDDIPILLIVIDNSFRIRYQTKMAMGITKLKRGDSLKKMNLDPSTLHDLTKAVQSFRKNHDNSISIPFDSNKSLILNPFYNCDKSIDHILIVGSSEPPNASVETYNKFSRTFYSIYPKFLDLNQSFPYEIQSNGRPFFILLFKLLGFNEWCDKTELNIVEKFRKDVSKCCDHLLQHESNFSRIRETGDYIIMIMNRDTKLSIWKILEVCSEFGNNVLNEIHKLTRDYNAPSIKGCALVFKVREPNYYFISRRCARTDFKNDSIFAGMARFLNCKPDIVNYTSQKKELKVSNTTKLKTCYTPDGEAYDIFIVV